MANNTRVNELQDKLLQAMDIINAQALKTVTYDKTIVCTIINDDDKKDGKYEVSDGSITFTAYSMETRYRKDDTVYVTIPQGNYDNQKMIIGKKTSETEQPFNFVTPFDTFFSMTGNIVKNKVRNGSLVANNVEVTDNTTTNKLKDCFTFQNLIALDEKDLSDTDYINYTRLGIKADFKSWIKNAVVGNYGLQLILTTEPIGNVEKEQTSQYTYLLDSSSMYGNPYYFETDYNQEIVLDISNENVGKIIGVELNFYQAANFYDQFNNPIPSHMGGYKKTEWSELYLKYPIDGEKNGEDQYSINYSGYYVGEGEILSPNLFVKNIEVHLGYDISMFNNDYVEIYTYNKSNYVRSTSIETDNIEENKKEIKMRWVHIADGEPVDMIAAADKATDEEKAKYEVRWYRYRVGAAAADPYSGIYWERIKDATGFNYTFNPDVNQAQEQVKAIVLYDSNTPYRSNELIFKNDETPQLSEEVLHIMNALTIECDDETNGNYMVYGQDNSIKDTTIGKTTRTLTAYFDANNDGIINKEIEIVQNYDNLIWTFPTENTMIELLNGSSYDEIELLDYEPSLYYIKNEDEYVLDDSVQVDANKIYYTIDDEGKYIEVLNLYIPNKYYIKDYKNCSDLSFDSVQYTYYIKQNDAYVQQDNLSIDDYQKNPANYYIYTYVPYTEALLDKTLTYYNYNIENSGYVINEQPKYKISSYYSPGKTNNTITCQYTLNGVVYTTEKEFTFGPAGTKGTDQTLVIDFAGDKNSVYAGEEVISFRVQLYDNQNIEQSIPNGEVEWAWYYNSDLREDRDEKGDLLGFPRPISNDKSAIWNSEYDFKIDGLYILQASVGNLTTYFPIPISNGQYSYIKGATQVIYQSSGEPSYITEEYCLYGKDDQKAGVDWKIVSFDEDPYVGTLSDADNNQGYLQPIKVYVKNAGVYGVQATNGNTILWTQPILVLQNQWASNVINAWDGKSIQIDNKKGTILSQALAAGKKDSDNRFSGVMIGNWKETDTASDITAQTGVYGFHQGAMSYAFKDDGTGFIGKDGRGRINFDGNNATIYSATKELDGSDRIHENGKNIGSMVIDFNEPYIEMKYDNKYILLDASKTGTVSSTFNYNAPFRIGTKFCVDWDGNIYAKDGHFEGTLYSEYGEIGGWSINESTLSGGDTTLDSTNGITTNYITIKSGNTEYGELGYTSSGAFGVVATNGNAYLRSQAVSAVEGLSDAQLAIRNGYGSGTKQTDYITINSENGIIEYSDKITLQTASGIYLGLGTGGMTVNFPSITFNTGKTPEEAAANQHGIYARFA